MVNFPNWAEKKIAKVIKSHSHDMVTVHDLYIECSSLIKPEALPPSLLIAAHRNMMSSVIKKLLKKKLPDNIVGAVKAKFPKEIAETLGAVSGWIALERGPEAQWVSSIHATSEQWEANAKLKHFVSRTIADASYRASDIARFLEKNKAGSLEEMMK